MATADDIADELYGLDPDEFTAARDRRAKELAAAGDKPAAAVVRKLRKPTVTAWALNRVARDRADDVAALLEAGSALRAAQQAAVTEGSADELRDASRREQQAVAGVAGLASAVLRDAGRQPTPAFVDRMTGTLRAAASGGEAADLLRTGRLTTDLSPAGFGLDALLGASLPAAQPARPARAPAPATRASRTGRASGEQPASSATTTDGAADRKAAERRAALEGAVREAEQRVEQLAVTADEAGRRADEAEQAAVAARQAAREADREVAQARQQLRDARARLDRASR